MLVAGAELARLPEAPYLYARGLVGCLDDDARQQLWLLCRMALRRGGSLHLEYPAKRLDLPPSQLDGLVRRRSTDRLIEEITASGGRVVHVEHGAGEGFFGEPDPYVGRIEARWSRDPDHREGAAMKDTVIEATTTRRKKLVRRALSVPARIADLEASVRENRRLNRRVAELTDVVAELLIPIADRDEEKVQEVLAQYRSTTFGH